jgi:hypothetical protein
VKLTTHIHLVVRNVWSYISTPAFIYMLWSLIKHQAQLYLLHYTGLLKNHATHIKIFIDGCNSEQFDWIKNTQYHCDYTRAHAGHVML